MKHSVCMIEQVPRHLVHCFLCPSSVVSLQSVFNWLLVHALQKPDSFRLACQLNVGDGKNSGTLKFRTKPK